MVFGRGNLDDAYDEKVEGENSRVHGAACLGGKGGRGVEIWGLECGSGGCRYGDL